MNDKIRDAFSRGKAVSATQEEVARARAEEDRRNLEQLWRELQRHSTLALEAGYLILPIAHWWIPIRREKRRFGVDVPYNFGHEAHVTWSHGVCRALAQDETGQNVFEFGATPADAAEKLMYYMALGTLATQAWD